MKRWLNDFKEFLPSLIDGARDYPLQMLFIALGIAVCLMSPARHEEESDEWRLRLGSWIIGKTPIKK